LHSRKGFFDSKGEGFFVVQPRILDKKKEIFKQVLTIDINSHSRRTSANLSRKNIARARFVASRAALFGGTRLAPKSVTISSVCVFMRISKEKDH
jgi:hypothetical protein